MAKTETITATIRVDTYALHRQLEHLGRTYQDVADSYFRAAQKVLEDTSPEPELDTSDLSDPEPKGVEIHNYPPNPEGWGDLLRAGTFADEPAHDRGPTPNEIHGSYGDDPEVDHDSRAKCRSLLHLDSTHSIHRWVIGCGRDLGHEGAHWGEIVWLPGEGR